MQPMTAKQVLDTYWDGNTIPVNVTAIAAKLNVYILGDPGMQASGHYTPEDIKLKAPLITYNPYESGTRTRFTIAHELGHHCLLHGEKDRLTPPDFNSDAKDQDEVQANKFAAELLMPEEAVRAMVSVRKITDISRLAKLFNVSRFAMAYRLEALGYALAR